MMEEDEYYLDRYDYQPQTSVSSTCASVSTSARQDSLGPGPDEEVEIDGVDYEDDYDHLYVDTDGAEQYLREIWSQLGVGYNGYLNLAELYRVCEHIGMSASEEMIEQLFDKLDNDQDGRVSFGEFADGLFKYVHKTTRTAPAATTTAAAAYSSPSHVPSAADPSDPVTSTSQYLDKQTLSPSEHNHPPTFHRFISTFTNFLTINTDKDGYTEPRRIIDLWQALGYTNGERILKSFGFNPKQYVNVLELWSQMEDRVCQCADNELYQISLATILNEFAQLKTSYEHLCGKCDSLQANLAEANARAEFLAQEVDEQHSQMEKSTQNKIVLVEKKYQDQIRFIENEFSREKEFMLMQACHLRQDIEKQMISVQEQIGKMRNSIIGLEEDNKRLEHEYHQIKEENGELQRNCLEMQKQVEECSSLQAKIVELESIDCLVDNQRHQDLLKEVDLLRKQNQKLKDQNDELIGEKDTLRQQFGLADCKQSILQLAMGNSVAFERIQKCNKRKKRRKRKNKQQRKEEVSATDGGGGGGKDRQERREELPVSSDARVHFEDEADDNMSVVSAATTVDDVMEQAAFFGKPARQPAKYRLAENDSCDDDEEEEEEEDCAEDVETYRVKCSTGAVNWNNGTLDEELMERLQVDSDCMEESLHFVIGKLIKECVSRPSKQLPIFQPVNIGDALARIKEDLHVAIKAANSNHRQVGSNSLEDELRMVTAGHKQCTDQLNRLFWDHYRQQQSNKPNRSEERTERTLATNRFDHNNNPQATTTTNVVSN